jgi:riboflavin synthase
MFTGIIETLATVEKIEKENLPTGQAGSNIHFTFSSTITSELKIDQSVAHNGVCLTVVKIEGSNYQVTAIDETLKRTNLSELKIGSRVNTERCMPANGRFDGHIVQGHVDTTAICKEIKVLNGSWEFIFEHTKSKNYITVEKGSITINGVSLTVVQSNDTMLSVCIIPYTYENTNFKELKPGSSVNLEFDIIGKYISKMLATN